MVYWVKKDVWYHMVGVYDRIENQTRIYLNGVMLDDTICSSAFITALNDTAWNEHDDGSIPTIIGAGGVAGATSEWDGRIDEVAIWNRSMNISEVQSLYNATYGEYYYNLTATDWNVNITGNFSITQVIVESEDCIFDCTVDTVTGNLDCKGEDFVVNNQGTLDIAYDVVNINKITGSGCRIAIQTGNKWD